MKKETEKTIAFLGAGNMAEALIKGILGAALFRPEEIIASDLSHDRISVLKDRYKIRTTLVNSEAAEEADIVIVGLKPSVVEPVLEEVGGRLTGKLLISVAAGIPLLRIRTHLHKDVAVIRAMPNAAALVLAGATVLAAGPNVTPELLRQGIAIFESIGRCWVLDESLLDAVTGLSGSGPAFVMVVIEGLTFGGVKCGLDYDMALALAAQTVYGAGKWLIESSAHPAALKDFVASPGGTTIAGLHKLESSGVRAGLISAVEAATLRSKELGRRRPPAV
ncbi:MAG: pyrroline-5-carboxylate reductase [Nitrospirae bacterium]|nr:pyrroline-5-carboxylate reductase [Candidatus Troglogloeales bacterium]MBI3598971.1 pyrroline-5-carboxylate reductase [Candidatus Troglogloeales bacterium]